MIQIHPQIYRLFAGWTGNQYLIVEETGVSLVDTGTPGSHRYILRRMADLGFRPEDLKYILITHADPDHCGALPGFQEQTHAISVASEWSNECLQSNCLPRSFKRTTFEGKAFSLLAPLFLPGRTCVDRIVQPGDCLPILGGLEVIDTEGHTPGHLSYFAPQQRILFSGDSIKFFPHLGPYQNDTTVDHQLARESFRRQMALKPRLICGGHGFARLDASLVERFE